MRPMTTEMLKKGYLLFPKALFEEQMNMKTGEKAADAFEAFVFVLTHVNYSTVTCNVRGHLFDCVRGESVLSLARCFSPAVNFFHSRRARPMFTLGCSVMS